jgi:hypothetical protein
MRKRRRGYIKKLWKPDPAWFWSFVDKNGPQSQHMPTNCWVWKAHQGIHGYGKVTPTTDATRKKFATLTAHRVAWELEICPIPEGRLVLHHCDNRSCVRPSHLFMGDDLANMRDMYQKNRGNKAHGEDQYLAKLTDKAVTLIRQARKQVPPVPLKELATHFGVTLVAVSWAAIGRTWKHVSEPPCQSIRPASR